MKKNYKISWQIFVAVGLMIFAGIYIKVLMFNEVFIAETPLEGFPQVIGSWENAGLQRLPDDVLDILQVDDYIMRDYKDRAGNVSSLYIGYYKSHRGSAEIHTPEHCQAGGGWEILDMTERDLNFSGAEEKMRFVEALYEKDQEKLLFFYWYYINGKYITKFYRYKLSIIVNSLLYHRSDASFVRIAVPVINDDVDSASSLGENFLKEVVPVINTYLK